MRGIRWRVAACVLLVMQLGFASAVMSQPAGSGQVQADALPPCHGDAPPAPSSSDHELPCCAAGHCHCATPAMTAPASWHPVFSSVAATTASSITAAALSAEPSRLLRPPIAA